MNKAKIVFTAIVTFLSSCYGKIPINEPRIWDNVLTDLAVDQTTLSYVEIIDSKIDNLNTNTNCCSSLDIISSVVNVIDSKISNLNINVTCSGLDQILQTDQTILSKVMVIDTRTNTISSNVNNIYYLDQTIDSKVDVTINLDNQILSSLSTIATATTTFDGFVSIFGDKITDGRLDYMSIEFQYGLPPNVTSTTANGGTVSNVSSMEILATSATNNSVAQIQTSNTIYYRGGHESYAFFTVAFTGDLLATSSQFIGPIDDTDGFAVGYDGATFGVTYRSFGVTTFVPQSQFNGDKINGTGPSGFSYDPTKINIFRIGYGYLGSAIVRFQISSNTGQWITFHTLQLPNTLSSPSISQPFLPITARVEGIANGRLLQLRTASWNGGIIGGPNTSSYRYYQTNNTLVNPSTSAESHILTIRNRSTFNSKANKIEVRCAAFGGGAIGNTAESTTIRLRKNATVTGTSYSNIDTNNSVIEVSTAGTYTASTGTLSLLYPCQNLGNGPSIGFIPKDTYEIIILPGETLTITAVSNSGGQTVLCGLAWEERF